jgi:hypothetical protein
VKFVSISACFALALVGSLTLASAAEETPRPIDGIMDNSFLIEEAYNQEEGIVQHIFNGIYSFNRFGSGGERRVDLSFTQEWPAYGLKHQFSYTVPYSTVREAGKRTDGLGDVLLNYRYQACLDEKTLTGFSPRFSLVLPTGDERKGFGNGTLGYQWNLPFSTTFGDRWFAHGNAGLTFLPNAGERPSHDFLNYNLGASVIYCPSGRLNLMLEWIANWNQGVAGSGEVERQFGSLISPGVRYAFNFRKEAQIVVGLGVPMGLTRTIPDIGVFLYLSFEHRVFGKSPAD